MALLLSSFLLAICEKPILGSTSLMSPGKWELIVSNLVVQNQGRRLVTATHSADAARGPPELHLRRQGDKAFWRPWEICIWAGGWAPILCTV